MSYTGTEVCRILGIKAHVLRYWEQEIPFFSQKKNLSGRKVYSDADMQLLFRLKYLLYEKKFTLRGAKDRIWDEIKNGNPDLKSRIAGIRSQLIGIREILVTREDSCMDQSTLIRQFKELKQEALFTGWAERTKEQKERLLRDLSSLKPELFKSLQAASRGQAASPKPVLTPVEYEPWLASSRDKAAYERGVARLAAGKTACLTVAGGQGSRLGLDGPKGKFPASPIRGASLFQLFAEKILAAAGRYQVALPWYIMTSPLNHEETIGFFKENEYFGLDSSLVYFFPQGVLPSLDEQGNLVLAPDGGLCRNPDGHGGLIQALAENKIFKDLKERQIEELFCFQIDNPLVNVPDPLFLGRHLARDSQLSLKVIKKRSPDEKLGAIGRLGDKPGVIEYSELEHEQMYARQADGELLYAQGSISIYIFNVDFLSSRTLTIPYHLARKSLKVLTYRHGEAEIQDIEGIKFEKFIFDLIPQAERVLFFETLREFEFSPLKNKSGLDSIETCQHDQIEKDARLLEACGITVPRQQNGRSVYKLEISPLYAADLEALKARLARDAVYRISKDTLLL